jgi:hypothetical protein
MKIFTIIILLIICIQSYSQDVTITMIVDTEKLLNYSGTDADDFVKFKDSNGNSNEFNDNPRRFKTLIKQNISLTIIGESLNGTSNVSITSFKRKRGLRSRRLLEKDDYFGQGRIAAKVLERGPTLLGLKHMYEVEFIVDGDKKYKVDPKLRMRLSGR